MSDSAIKPDLAVVVGVVDIGVPLSDCWLRIGNFADAGQFLDVPSTLVSGSGDIGSVRQIGGAILEAMVGRTEASYTYVQTSGPMAPFLYHGCVALHGTGPESCTLTYTITYDQTSMEAARRESELARIGGRFQGAADAMKRFAELGDPA